MGLFRRWASRKIRHWGIVMMRKRNRAATKIAFAWLYQKTGRLQRHLEIKAKKLEEVEEVRRLRRMVETLAGINRYTQGIRFIEEPSLPVLGQAIERQLLYDAAARIQAIVHGIWTRRDVKRQRVRASLGFTAPGVRPLIQSDRLLCTSAW